jgi:hypothetical protein
VVDVLSGLTGCSSDDDCATDEVCVAGACEAEPRRRPARDDDDDDTGEGEGEGEGEAGEGEGEGEGPDSLGSLVDVAVESVVVPATCAGATAEAVVLVTSTATAPTTIAVVPPAGVTVDITSFTIDANETIELRVELPVPLVLGTSSERVQLFADGLSSLDVDVDVTVTADAVVDVEVAPAQNDVLLVVENSGSMSSTADSEVQSDVATFVRGLFEVPATRVSVINTDGDFDVGQARPGCSGATLLSTSSDVQCAIDELWTTFAGSGDEQALVAITTWAATTSALRPAAQLTIVSLGDSNDNSTRSTSTVATQLQALAPDQTQAVAMFSLFDDDEACNTATNATNHRIAAVTTAVGGAFGSICSATDRATVFDAALAATAATTTVAPGLPATGDVVVCVVDDGGTCVIVPGAARRVGSGVVLDVEDGAAVQVMTAETCAL